MRRLKKNIYIGLFCATVGVLLIIKAARGPAGMNERGPAVTEDSVQAKSHSMSLDNNAAKAVKSRRRTDSIPHPIYSVPSYDECFPDLQDVQIASAQRLGVSPVRDRKEAENRKKELVYVGMNPYYVIDKGMSSSIPYLIPRAAVLLNDIAHNFVDSLYVKGIPLHKVIVTSVLRTEHDVANLRKRNPNASEQSCHRHGTTFDICYNRYHTVALPGETRREVRNDTLKWILSEVLRDQREMGRCHIKHEVKQSCFHITVK